MSKKDKAAKSDAAGPGDQDILQISKALSDPRRLEVLRKIAGTANASCMDMRQCLTMNPATLSHHIKTLEGAGLIETHRDGKLLRATIRRKTWKSYLAHLKQFTA
jgi:ArsR family transcriptional regulator